MQDKHIMVFQTLLSCVLLIYFENKLGREVLFVRFRRIILFIFIFMAINAIAIGNVKLKHMIDAVINMPCLAILLYYTKLRKWIAFSIYLFVLIYMIYAVFVRGVPFDEVTVNNYNYISYHLMLYSIPFFWYCCNNDKLVNIIVPLTTFVMAALATGRGGILCTGVVLLYSLYLIFRGKWRDVWIQKIVIGICLLGIVIAGISEYADYIDLATSRFTEYGMESSGRSKGWALYLQSCLNPFYLISGAPVDAIPYLKNHLLGSLHNSYLTLHAREGIFGLVVIVMMVKGLLKIYKLKYYHLFILLGCLMQKGFTDADVGGNMVGGDLYVYLLIMFYLEEKYMQNQMILSAK